MYSCSFFFSLALIFTLEAASMCHFLSASIKFSCFPSNEIRHLCILSFASALSSVTHLSVDIRSLSKKKKKTYSDLLSFFLSKSLGGHAIYRQKRAGARNTNFLPVLMKGWTYVRTYVRVRDFDRTNFFTHGAPLDSSSIISFKLFTNSQFGVKYTRRSRYKFHSLNALLK